MVALKAFGVGLSASLRTRVVGIAQPFGFRGAAAAAHITASSLLNKAARIGLNQSRSNSFTARAGALSDMDDFDGPDAAVLMQNPDVQVATFALG